MNDDTFALVALRDEVESLRTELAAANSEVTRARKQAADIFTDGGKQIDALRAELAAAREAIKDAYFEGWGDAHECGNDQYDWSKSWAKRVYVCASIDTALKGGEDE